MSAANEVATQACSNLSVSCSQGNLPIVISFLALLVAFGSALLAFRKNRNDLSTPWVTILLKYIEEEFKSVDQHQGVFKRICSTPFPDMTRKRKVVEEFYRLRDESSRRLSELCALVPAASELRDMRAGLDGVSDSFFENDSLRLPPGTASDLQGRYSEKLQSYLETLRKFSRGVWQRDVGF